MGFASASFGVVCYSYSMYTVLLAIAFMINLKYFLTHPVITMVFPYAIDGDNEVTGNSKLTAFLIDNAVLGTFAITHSLFARPALKRAFGMPEVYRSVYCLVSAATLHAICAFWQVLDPTPLWSVKGPALYLGYAFGAFLLFTSTFAVDHFHLFGLTQSVNVDFNGFILRALGVQKQDGNITRFLHYNWVRHPIMTGFFIMFFCVPTMTVTHMFFSMGASAYILLAVFLLEEPDLITELGDEYIKYKNEVPAFCPCFVCGKASPGGMY